MSTLEACRVPHTTLVTLGGYERIGPCVHHLMPKPFHHVMVAHPDHSLPSLWSSATYHHPQLISRNTHLIPFYSSLISFLRLLWWNQLSFLRSPRSGFVFTFPNSHPHPLFFSLMKLLLILPMCQTFLAPQQLWLPPGMLFSSCLHLLCLNKMSPPQRSSH